MAKKSEYITFRTDLKTKTFLETRAENEERSLSWIINKILTEYISNEDKKGEEAEN